MASEEAAPPRLVITKMTLENFKSYAGIQEIGPFHENFSCVVGPNGSGKSNVIDALLFVFGYRAKKLRLNKVSELIHHSENHSNYAHASVAVHFAEVRDAPDGSPARPTLVAGSELVVSRTARRDNSSSYYLNGKKKPFAEVADVLRGKGIDLTHNRFLILQGEVESIATMKSKGVNEGEVGLLEYLEDIIGTNTYVEPIAQANAVVAELNEQRQEQLNRVKFVEKEKNALEGAAKEAEECLDKEAALGQRKLIVHQLDMRAAVEVQGVADGKVKGLRADLDATKAQLAEMESTLEELSAQYKRVLSEHKTIDSELAATKKHYADFETRDIQLRRDYEHNKTQRKKRTEQMKRDKKKVAKAASEVEAAHAEVERLTALVAQLDAEQEEAARVLEGMYEATKETTAEIGRALEAKQKEVEPLKKAVNEARADVDVLKGELDIISARFTSARAEHDAAVSDIAQMSATRDKHTAAIAAAQQTKETLAKQVGAAEEALGGVVAREEALSGEVKELTRAVEEGRVAQHAASQARGGGADSAVVQGVMRAAQKGRLSGVHGRLGALGTIDDKYDVAVSTACSALHHIVVDTVDDGQEAVQFLREAKLGRGTFIMLEKMGYVKPHMAKKCVTPEGVPRLFDLITPHKAVYAPAFYFALRDTLVADTLDQATRIAFSGRKRWRVVTLDGQLIDLSGTMSGGGNKVARGGMSGQATATAADAEAAAVSADALKAKEARLAKATAELKLVRKQKAKLEKELIALRKQQARLEVDLPKAEMEVAAINERLPAVEARVPELLRASKPTKEEKKKGQELDKAIRAAEKVLAAATDAAARVEAEVAELQARILDVGGEPLRVQKAQVEALKKQSNDASTAITKCNVRVKTLTAQGEKATAAIAAGEKEIETLKARGNELKAEAEKLEGEAESVMAAVTKTQELMAAKEDELHTIQAEHERLKKRVGTVRSAEIDIANQLDDASRGINDAQKRVLNTQHHIEQLLERYKDVVLPERNPEPEEEEEDAEKGAEGGAAAATRELVRGLHQLGDEELAKHDARALQREIAVLEDQLSKMKPNMAAIEEHRKKEDEYLSRVADLDAVTARRDAARGEYEALRSRRLDEFMAGFTVITMKLKEMYQMITLGGDAELELVDSLDPFSEGIVFSVRPPKKSWKNIQNLSGGEKTLSSLALVFALHHYKPTPLYVMDEIDAALDFKNVSIVGNYIKERTKNAQFVIISLRNNMFELADRLVGIYKTQNCTKSIAINPAAVHIPVSVKG